MKPNKITVLTTSMTVALSGACLYLLAEREELRRSGLPAGQAALEIEEIRAAVVAELVAQSTGIFDSHPDPDVGRVLIPGLSGTPSAGALVHSNAWGMRERDYALPKPPDTVRVVLLGDSVVYGRRAAAEDRMGVFLEGYLRERTSYAGSIECLHLGIGSWNALAEIQFLRRQLSELDPDLVIQVLVPNDLDDNPGVRGFGTQAEFSPRYRARAGSRVSLTYPARFGPPARDNFILRALDWESRHRYEEVADELARLSRAVEDRGVSYVLVVNWPRAKPILRKFLEGRLASEVVYLPSEYHRNKEHWSLPTDPHWNRAGHENFARFLYGFIRQRELLPMLDLAAWPEVENDTAEALSIGEEEAREDPHPWRVQPESIATHLDFRNADADTMAHVYAGIDDRGNVSPYASLILRNASGQSLRILARGFERPELDGARVAVLVDELDVGDFRIVAGASIDRVWQLPAAVRERSHLSVRFEADDWVYSTEPPRRECISFILEDVEILAK